MTDHSPTADQPADVDVLGMEFIPGGVDPKTLKISANVRIDPRVESDAGFLASIRERGVRTPIAAYRDGAGDLHVLRGQRRTLGACIVGRDRVPVMVEPEPSAADRLADQIIENDQRAGLVAAEHAAAYEEMTLLGLSADDIARMSATPLPKVRAGLQVAGNKKASAAAAANPGMDLLQVAAYAEFADDADATKRLDDCLEHGYSWDRTVQTLRDTRSLQQARAAKEAELGEAGLKVLTGVDHVSYYDPKVRPVDRIWDDEPIASGKNKGKQRKFTVAKHQQTCKGHAVYLDSKFVGRDEAGVQQYDFEVVHVCRDFPKYKHTPMEGSSFGSDKTKLADMDPDDAAKERAERRKVKANNQAMRTATTLRHRFVAEIANRKKVPAGAGKMMAAAMFRDRDKMRFSLERGSRTAHELFGFEKPDWTAHADFIALGDDVGDVRGELMALVVMLAAYEDNADQACWRLKDGGLKRYLLFLQSIGYELSPVEEMAAGLREVVNVDELAGAAL